VARRPYSMPAQALVIGTRSTTNLPRTSSRTVEVPEAEGHEDVHEADVRIVAVTVSVVTVPVTVPSLSQDQKAQSSSQQSPSRSWAKAGGDGHRYHHKDRQGQEHNSTHKLPPL
jgi:hypothetical protein